MGGELWGCFPGYQHCLPGRQCCSPGKTGGPFACLTYYLDCLTDLLGENCLPGGLGKLLACLLPWGNGAVTGLPVTWEAWCSDRYIVLLGPRPDQHSSKLICQPWMYFLTWNKYQFKLKVNGVWYSIQ